MKSDIETMIQKAVNAVNRKDWQTALGFEKELDNVRRYVVHNCKKSKTLRQNYSAFRFSLGQAHAMTGNYTEAEKYLIPLTKIEYRGTYAELILMYSKYDIAKAQPYLTKFGVEEFIHFSEATVIDNVCIGLLKGQGLKKDIKLGLNIYRKVVKRMEDKYKNALNKTLTLNQHLSKEQKVSAMASMTLNNHYAIICIHLASYLQKEKRLDEALTYAKKAINKPYEAESGAFVCAEGLAAEIAEAMGNIRLYHEFLEKGVAKENATCCHNLAYDCQFGTAETTPNYPRAEELYLKAYVQGHPKSANQLGNLWKNGSLGKYDYEKAEKYYKEAIARGSNLSTYGIAAIYIEKLLLREVTHDKLPELKSEELAGILSKVPANSKEALTIRENLSKAKAYKSPNAFTALSWLYEYGLLGFAKNSREALTHLFIGIELGSESANVTLFNHIDRALLNDEISTQRFSLLLNCYLDLLEQYGMRDEEINTLRTSLLEIKQLSNMAAKKQAMNQAHLLKRPNFIFVNRQISRTGGSLRFRPSQKITLIAGLIDENDTDVINLATAINQISKQIAKDPTSNKPFIDNISEIKRILYLITNRINQPKADMDRLDRKGVQVVLASLVNARLHPGFPGWQNCFKAVCRRIIDLAAELEIDDQLNCLHQFVRLPLDKKQAEELLTSSPFLNVETYQNLSVDQQLDALYSLAICHANLPFLKKKIKTITDQILPKITNRLSESYPETWAHRVAAGITKPSDAKGNGDNNNNKPSNRRTTLAQRCPSHLKRQLLTLGYYYHHVDTIEYLNAKLQLDSKSAIAEEDLTVSKIQLEIGRFLYRFTNFTPTLEYSINGLSVDYFLKVFIQVDAWQHYLLSDKDDIKPTPLDTFHDAVIQKQVVHIPVFQLPKDPKARYEYLKGKLSPPIQLRPFKKPRKLPKDFTKNLQKNRFSTGSKNSNYNSMAL